MQLPKVKLVLLPKVEICGWPRAAHLTEALVNDAKKPVELLKTQRDGLEKAEEKQAWAHPPVSKQQY